MPLTKEQLAARKVGGSDVATILGLNPYKSALELYYEKRGEIAEVETPVAEVETPVEAPAEAEIIEKEDQVPGRVNPHIEAGIVLEDAIAELAQRHMSRYWSRQVRLRRCNLTLTHPKYDWISAHIDRDVVGEERGVELKNVGARSAKFWGDPHTDEIPDYYLPQPMTYMLIMDYPVWTVAAYFGGADLRLYEIARDSEWDVIILEATHKFWFDHVLADVPPPVDFSSPRALEVVRKVFKTETGEVVQADRRLEHWRYVYRDAVKEAAGYLATADRAKAHMLNALGNGAILKFPSGYAMERKIRDRAGYTVEPTTYVDVRFKKLKS